MAGESWTCPYCDRPCTIGDRDVRRLINTENISEDHGQYRSVTTVTVCPNPDCRGRSISLAIFKVQSAARDRKIHEWNLLPESSAKVFPTYIPEQIRRDYEEACLIKDKSPKASATLSRRCLQGMIRDFWSISKGNLNAEIKALYEHVDEDTWRAIDAVRSIGNIGAHMEKDVNLIVDVEPDEAKKLIGLIETLFQEWYIAQHERKERMAALEQLAHQKQTEKSGGGGLADADGGTEETH